ncbi:hypothetical protein TG4357_01142 [Thalassovita gelatinovora]|uniref:Uncharacterized protein n=1 Tax=Thalassovita gelatinovora TaxID=53501 RepID=A0A0P1FTV0_THAGE|nr:hypothetical protein [Thalassovita gelatinovora]QIZ80302.1 hypothetical protein HFZ77_07360 [Thalassovita gelatinovora]CUH64205.1 hypothetical protein TG4357_01142 [Thalassovita gelatinovora]SEQ85438.1 hypothetical protein SAMN04488043_109183 [Thalassovita gelatinovora]
MKVSNTILAVVLALGLTGGSAATAGDWYEPQRGTALRQDLMDALRPHAWWQLGKPVQFVVDELRVSGDVAFAMVMPQRPGGGAIDPATTPMAQRGDYYPDDTDGVHMEAIFVKSGNMWVVVEFSIGGTDAWWAGWPFCDTWRDVIPEYCGG